MNEPLLAVEDLQTHFFTAEGVVRAVNGVTFQLEAGKVKGIVGESGCGKSVMARSIMRMVQSPGRTIGGSVRFAARDQSDREQGVDLLSLEAGSPEMREIRGGQIAMIFQEPRAALSPVHTIGDQITENIRLHQDVDGEEAHAQAIDLLDRVHIPQPADRMRSYAHQLSGGMCQRVMIAMALSGRPSLLIADEPTTALDVTTEAQILDLLLELDLTMMFITHDLGVLAEIADEIVVMYLGQVVEQGTVTEVFNHPRHPYTRDLLASLPRVETRREWLTTMRGSVPDPYAPPVGCPFHPRCAEHRPGLCDSLVPMPIPLSDGREVRCLMYAEEHAAGFAGHV